MIEELTRPQLKAVASALHRDDSTWMVPVLRLITLVRQYERGDRILLWCVREGLVGQRFVEFFKNEADDAEDMGVLRGVETAIRIIDGRMYNEKMYLDSLKG